MCLTGAKFAYASSSRLLEEFVIDHLPSRPVSSVASLQQMLKDRCAA